MIRLYAGSGSGEIRLLNERFGESEWMVKRQYLVRLLTARSEDGALRLLERLPFRVHEGTNWFGDEFSVLYARVPIEQYVESAALEQNKAAREAALVLAGTLGELGTAVRFIAFELDAASAPETVAAPAPQITIASVSRALNDAEQLLRTNGPISAIDRVHTAIHGYLRTVCRQAGIAFSTDAGMTALFRLLRNEHPAFQDTSSHSEHIGRVGGALATILDALNPVRNRASVAHANEELLDEADAMLAVNAGRTMLHYLDAKHAGSRSR